MEEWIVAVGKHKPIISGADWVKVQNMLGQNKSKSYRKPRSNVALLSGLLFCGNCGDYMRPKLSKRVNKDGEQIYSYLCQTKEKSRMQICDSKNPNGNILDALVCEHIKQLSEHSSDFIQQLEKAKKQIEESGQEYDSQLETCKKELEGIEKQIKALVTALAQSNGTTTYEYVNQQIEELHNKKLGIENRIEELKCLTHNHQLSDKEFDVLRDMLCSFAGSFETMNIEEKRAALRLFVKKVVWDGKNAQVYLFGADSDDIEYPDTEGEIEPMRGVANEILMVMRAGKNRQRETSLQDPIGTDTEGNTISLLNVIYSDDEDIDDTLVLKSQVKKLYEAIEKKLAPREKKVLQMRYGLGDGEPVTQREIAKMLNISRSYVSRIETKALGS